MQFSHILGLQKCSANGVGIICYMLHKTALYRVNKQMTLHLSCMLQQWIFIFLWIMDSIEILKSHQTCYKENLPVCIYLFMISLLFWKMSDCDYHLQIT